MTTELLENGVLDITESWTDKEFRAFGNLVMTQGAFVQEYRNKDGNILLVHDLRAGMEAIEDPDEELIGRGVTPDQITRINALFAEFTSPTNS